METRASSGKASDGVKRRRWPKMFLRPTDLLLPPELRAILIGAPRAGKSHFVKEVLRELKRMRPMQRYLKVL